MFTKSARITALIILTIFCFTQTGFAASYGRNLRTEAAAQGKFETEVGKAVIASDNFITPQRIKTKSKDGAYKIDFRLPTGQIITMRMNVQSLGADNDRILEIESTIRGKVHGTEYDLFSDSDTSAQAAVERMKMFFSGICSEQKEGEPLNMNVAGAEDRLQGAIKALIVAVDVARQAAAGQSAAAVGEVREAPNHSLRSGLGQAPNHSQSSGSGQAGAAGERLLFFNRPSNDDFIPRMLDLLKEDSDLGRAVEEITSGEKRIYIIFIEEAEGMTYKINYNVAQFIRGLYKLDKLIRNLSDATDAKTPIEGYLWFMGTNVQNFGSDKLKSYLCQKVGRMLFGSGNYISDEQRSALKARAEKIGENAIRVLDWLFGSWIYNVPIDKGYYDIIAQALEKFKPLKLKMYETFKNSSPNVIRRNYFRNYLMFFASGMQEYLQSQSPESPSSVFPLEKLFEDLNYKSSERAELKDFLNSPDIKKLLEEHQWADPDVFERFYNTAIGKFPWIVNPKIQRFESLLDDVKLDPDSDDIEKFKKLLEDVDSEGDAGEGEAPALAGAAGEVIAEINTMALELVGRLPAEKVVTIEHGSAVVITNEFAFDNGFLAFLPSLADGMLKDASEIGIIIPLVNNFDHDAQLKLVEQFNAVMPSGKKIKTYISENQALKAIAAEGLKASIYGTQIENILNKSSVKLDLAVLFYYKMDLSDYKQLFDSIQERFKNLQETVATEA